jgi:putative transposase
VDDPDQEERGDGDQQRPRAVGRAEHDRGEPGSGAERRTGQEGQRGRQVHSLAWRVSITLEVDCCLEAVKEALAGHGKPAILNTDQGSQFTSTVFTGLPLKNGIAISMDGRGAWRDNVFVERLWRSVRYEEVYLRAYETVAQARRLIGRYLDFFNSKRPHSSLGARTPDHLYFASLPTSAAAA